MKTNKINELSKKDLVVGIKEHGNEYCEGLEKVAINECVMPDDLDSSELRQDFYKEYDGDE